MPWIGHDKDDPREIEEFKRGTTKEAKEEFNKFLKDRGLEITIINGHICLIPRTSMDGFIKPSHIEPKKCTESDCQNTYIPDREGSIGAYNQGWFLQRNRQSWCPEHIPDWVDEWRKRTRGDFAILEAQAKISEEKE